MRVRRSSRRSIATSARAAWWGPNACACDWPRFRRDPSLVASAVGCGALEDVVSDDQAVDLVGALVDLGALGVAHHPLDGELARVAATPEELHGICRDAH